MKYEAMQKQTESEQISLTLSIENMTSAHVGIKTNQFTVLEDFSTESEEPSQGTDQNIQTKELSQGTDQNTQIETEGTWAQQMEVDS
ncbi:hypothetical protein F8M41_023016 [Gigaspora margarita]|uniref:Uncharacterized protein n=1 Tax=Gigaspora margarita TaxID=4874 RepID=A0A8H4AE39_GIGMA|nr:hypothetical protein F8M41_023016 [Gigaspora margarita]